MTETLRASTDTELLNRYARQQDEGAFAQLVQRHQSMVLGAAARRTGNIEMARDVAQQVFVLLARKAAHLLRHERLAGWLYQTASYEAAKIWKSEQRRQARHAELAVLASPESLCNEQWQGLEDAMIALGSSDREAIVMHYFQDQSYAEMAAASALSEAAMRKRVSRALEQLSRQLQRRSHPVSAVALLTTAAAMQTTVTANASFAASVLAISGQAHAVTWVPWTVFMTTNTTLKTTAAVVLLAAVPLVWQSTENAGLRAEGQSRTQASQSPPSTTVADSPAATARNNPADLTAAQAKLQALRVQRAAAETRLNSLQAQSAKLKDEVVVSLGRLDEVALKIAELQLLALEVNRLEGRPDEQEKLLPKLMALTTEMTPVMAEYRQIGADPKLSARMAATTTAKVAGVSEAVRAEMERRLLGHYERMHRNGLSLNRRPAQNRADWDRRYGEASAAAMRDIESLVPAALRETPMWKSQTSAEATANLDFLDAAFGDPTPKASNPPAKTAP
jgi:RNA polymerase sigma factor (sigma-70 family)